MFISNPFLPKILFTNLFLRHYKINHWFSWDSNGCFCIELMEVYKQGSFFTTDKLDFSPISNWVAYNNCNIDRLKRNYPGCAIHYPWLLFKWSWMCYFHTIPFGFPSVTVPWQNFNLLLTFIFLLGTESVFHALGWRSLLMYT